MSAIIDEAQADRLRQRLVGELEREGSLRSPAWRDALLEVPRHLFLPDFTVSTDLSHVVWRKSSRSDTGASTCVEVANLDHAVAVRDSTSPSGPALIITPTGWSVFLGRVKAGALDL